MSTKKSHGVITDESNRLIKKPDATQDELIMVNTLDGFVQMITAWHSANVEVLRKLRDIPGDGMLKFQFEEKEYLMEGDLHIGYRMGIQTALGMLGQLPFDAFKEDPAPAEQPPASNDEPQAS